MNRTSRIIFGIALLALGIGWALEITGIISIQLDGWWTLFIIIPCFIALFSSHDKTPQLTGLGIGILLLLATRGIILWNDFWKYVICLVCVIWGIALILNRGKKLGSNPDRTTVNELKKIDQHGREIRQINVSFGKQLFEFVGQRLEGAEVRTCFGFAGLDLRGADILDGAIINVECSFGGMEIRAGNDICVKTAIESSFAGVECHHNTMPDDAAKTIYIKGKCSFGGIEIK